jgi:hypothetical protein
MEHNIEDKNKAIAKKTKENHFLINVILPIIIIIFLIIVDFSFINLDESLARNKFSLYNDISNKIPKRDGFILNSWDFINNELGYKLIGVKNKSISFIFKLLNRYYDKRYNNYGNRFFTGSGLIILRPLYLVLYISNTLLYNSLVYPLFSQYQNEPNIFNKFFISPASVAFSILFYPIYVIFRLLIMIYVIIILFVLTPLVSLKYIFNNLECVFRKYRYILSLLCVYVLFIVSNNLVKDHLYHDNTMATTFSLGSSVIVFILFIINIIF